MAELRLDPVRRRWVVTGKRPALPDALDSGEQCPFCRGHEHFTPPTIYERKGPDGLWTIRVFPDRAPLFRVEGELERVGEGMFDRMSARGAHEVIVETSQHGVMLAQQPVEQIAQVLEVYRDRILDLKRDHRFRYVSVFKEQGRGVAVRDEHGHSQILATPVVPALAEMEFRWSRFHYRRKDRCIFCDIVQQELRSAKRIVDETADFVSLCPYGARFPFELWILPVEHQPAFERDLSGGSRVLPLASLLKISLQRIGKICERLRLVVHTEPNVDAKGPAADWWGTIREDYHWHIEIIPELDAEPGYFGSEGFYFNPIPAEEAALVLRALDPEPSPAPPSE